MKHFIFCSCLYIFSITANAQIQKNQWMVGGAISGSYSSTTPSENSPKILGKDEMVEFRTPLNIGYFLANKWAVGVRGSYGYKKNIIRSNYISVYLDPYSYPSQSYTEITNQYSFNLFSRYYLLPKSNKFNIYVEAAYGIGRFNRTTVFQASQTTDVTSNINFQGFNGNIAPVYFINKHIALEFILSYFNQLNKQSANHYTNTFLMGIGLQVHLNEPKQQ